MELLDYYDSENKEKLGTKERDFVHEENLWHREITVWILNDKKEVLIQKRSANKKQAPNKWGLCSGHIDPNETELQTAVREVFEETRIKLEEKDLEFIDIYVNNDEGNKHFKYIYFARTNMKIEDMIMQEEEVSELKYITIPELKKIVTEKNPNYTFSNKSYMEKILKLLEEKESTICK